MDCKKQFVLLQPSSIGVVVQEQAFVYDTHKTLEEWHNEQDDSKHTSFFSLFHGLARSIGPVQSPSISPSQKTGWLAADAVFCP